MQLAIKQNPILVMAGPSVSSMLSPSPILHVVPLLDTMEPATLPQNAQASGEQHLGRAPPLLESAASLTLPVEGAPPRTTPTPSSPPIPPALTQTPAHTLSANCGSTLTPWSFRVLMPQPLQLLMVQSLVTV